MKKIKTLIVLGIIFISCNSVKAVMNQFIFDVRIALTPGGAAQPFCFQLCQGRTIYVKNVSTYNSGPYNPCGSNNANSDALTGSFTIRRAYAPFTLYATVNCSSAPGGTWNYGEEIAVTLPNVPISIVGLEYNCTGYAAVDFRYSGTDVSAYCSDGSFLRDTYAIKTYTQPVANAGPDLSICQPGQPVTLNAGGVGTPNWTGPNGFTCNNCSSTSVAPLSTSTYTLTVTNSSGCFSTDQVNVNVTNGPSVSNFSLTAVLVSDGLSHTYVAPTAPPGPICGSSIKINASATTCEDGYWIGVWETDASANRTYQYEWGKWFPGQAPNSLIDIQALATQSQTGGYWINGPSNRWNNPLFGGNLAVAPFTARYYRIEVCTDDPTWTCRTMLIRVDGNCRLANATDISEQNQTEINKNLEVYPNPANEIFNIRMLSGESVTGFNVLDMAGKTIKSITNPKLSEGVYSIDVLDLKNGIYFLEAVSENNKFISKVSIQK